MSIEQLTPDHVAIRLREDPDAVYLDVRSEQEFEQGHPEGALNVPILHIEGGVRRPNPDFLAVVEVHVDKAAAVYVGCASGQRSFQAAMLMKERGWTVLANVDGGFTGKRDPLGNVLQPGWKDLGLPSAAGDAGERSWSSLRQVVSE